MRFQVLGPLRVWDGDDWSAIRAAQPRVVLAVLLTQRRQAVSAERLAEELWGDRPPRTALNTIQVYVVRLRRLVGADRLLTRGRGYLLDVPDGELDSMVFERLIEEGHRRLVDGQLASGVDQLAEALSLWRGPAMHDVPDSPIVRAEVDRLEQRRVTALEARLGAELELGRHTEVVDELGRLVSEHPLRERLRGHLMLALYRCGRRAEALEVYRSGRAELITELGMEPGPDLRELERAILADEVRPPGLAIRVTPAQLPADVAGFTGRAAPLRELDALGSVAPVVIVGSAGVGKTALAVHWAHRIRNRFPDGQLYVDLRGYADDPPVRPIDALGRFLRALGVPAEQVPTDVDVAAALYRSVLAHRRMLVVLDNAHHPDQVRPLLPGTPGCRVVITSRNALTGLVALSGAHRLRLEVLPTDEASTLLAHLLGADRIGDNAAELARLCAGLPLALRITAANLAAYPDRAVSGYLDELRAGNRLAALEVDGDAQAAVRASFDLSYAALPDDARRMFRLLGLVPGPDVAPDAAAALSGTTTVAAERLLARLAAAHLADRHESGRYGSHDLLRMYARERGELEDPEANRAAATLRLHEWYLHTVDAAATMLYPQMRRLMLPAQPERSSRFAGDTEALAWLDAERTNLVAAVTTGPPAVAGLLADALRGYFWLRMYTVDWFTVASAGLAAAEHSGDQRARTGALLSLADVHFKQGRHQEAVEYSTRALHTARQCQWPEGEAAALQNLGNLNRRLGRLPEAVDYHRRALAINRRNGRLTSQVNNLSNLGDVYRELGDLSAALTQFTESLAINRELGTRHGEAVNLSNVGTVLHELGRFGEAAEHLHLALEGHREVGDRSEEVETRNGLAAVFRDTGDHGAALEHAGIALTVARDIAYRSGEIDVLNTLGTIALCLSLRDEAADRHRTALALARDIAYRLGEAKALIGLATAGRDLAAAREALAMAAAMGYRGLEAQARSVLAALSDANEVDAGTPAPTSIS
jgi:DNA-binding SARP family transcriptional activator/tetratricopeptide (TPR) repeat protein